MALWSISLALQIAQFQQFDTKKNSDKFSENKQKDKIFSSSDFFL